MKELATRILVALVGIPLLVFCIWNGGIWFFSLICLLCILGQIEIYNLAKAKQINPNKTAGIILTILILFLIGYGSNNLIISMTVLMMIIILGFEMFRNQGSPLTNSAATFLGTVYPGLFLGSMIYLRFHVEELFSNSQGNSAQIYILALFIAVWICDTFAYFAGVTLGRHRLFERVSPKKSIEGSVAGLAGAITVFLILGWLELIQISWIFLVLSGLIIGVLGQVGDLVESWLKRDAGVKDSSKILLGHGGIMDRFDSLTFISPAILILFFLWL